MATEVVQAYIDNVYSKFGGSLHILSDNGIEFKNQIFEQVAKELGVKYKRCMPPYCPASNGQIEGFHNFHAFMLIITKRYVYTAINIKW